MKIQGYEINNIVCDSRETGPDTIFVCVCGFEKDGHLYAEQAYKNGCRFFICERELSLPEDAYIEIVSDSRIAMASYSAKIYGYPANELKIIAVTGTKGKSTVASLLYEIMNASGSKTALIGTTGINIGEKYTETVNTTPESNILHKTFREALDCGCEYVVMEVSSQAVKLNRIFGLDFYAGIYTNLSPDHIGGPEHKDYEEYRECKSLVFTSSDHSIINADDPEFTYMACSAGGTVSFYTAENNENDIIFDGFGTDYKKAEVYRASSASITKSGGLGTSFILRGREYFLKTPGKFSVYNALAVIAFCDYIGIDMDIVAAKLAVTAVKGRFEPVAVMDDRAFIIDYAHNKLSLESALLTLREYEPKRLVCLFGSVGGRSVDRRAELGRTAALFADFSIITSDQPDKENPLDIISDIERNMNGAPHVCIADRAEAVKYAVENSKPGDIVLFAGKGHELYQLIEGTYVPFNEREIITKTAHAMIAGAVLS